jgi:hypothetical protein
VLCCLKSVSLTFSFISFRFLKRGAVSLNSSFVYIT